MLRNEPVILLTHSASPLLAIEFSPFRRIESRCRAGDGWQADINISPVTAFHNRDQVIERLKIRLPELRCIVMLNSNHRC